MKKRLISAYVSGEEYKKFAEISEDFGFSMSSMLRSAVKEWIADYDKNTTLKGKSLFTGESLRSLRKKP